MVSLGTTTAIATGSRKKHTWSIKLTENTASVDTNTSGMTIKLTMGKSGSTWAYWGAKIQYYVKVVNKDNENEVYYNTGWRNAPDHYPNSDSNLTWISGDTFNVGHDQYGKRKVRVYFELKDNANGKNENGYYYTPGNAYGYLDYTLSTIPRYLSFTEFKNTSNEETIANFSWKVSDPRDYTQYSLNSGSWTDAGDTVAADNKSGTFKIRNLAANTKYTLKIRCKRTDSQLWTESSQINFTTENWPYVTAVSSSPLTIGNSQTLTLHNPLGRECYIYMRKDNASGQLFPKDANTNHLATTTAKTVNFVPPAGKLYESIPSAQSGTAYYYCTYAGHTLAGKTGIYTCDRNACKPTFASNPISYIDTNATTKNLMADNGVSIVQNKSVLQISFIKAQEKNSATISQYRVSLGNMTQTYSTQGTYSLGTVNLTQNTPLRLVAIDSRGYESDVQEVSVRIVPWAKPGINTLLQRQSNYDAQKADLTVEISSFSALVNANGVPKNKINKISYTYQSNENTPSTGSGTLDLTTNKKDGIIYTYTKTIENIKTDLSYTFTVNVMDELSSENYIYPLDRGIPILTIDTIGLGVGVNCFPDEGEGLYVKHIDNMNKQGSKWYEGRDIATARNMNTATDSFHPVITQKTKNGAWSIGNLGGQDGLYFSYVTDSDYDNHINNSKTYILGTDGRFNGGVQVTSGTTAPNNANGANGDVYIQI